MEPSPTTQRSGRSRRVFLAAAATSAAGVLAGCTGRLARDREADARIRELEAEVARLEDALANEQADTQQLRAHIDDLEAELHRLEADLAASEDANQAQQAELEILEAELDEYRKRLETWNIWGFSDGELETLQALASEWIRSVVAVDVLTDDGMWSVGTGWMIADDVVVTNAHVVRPQRLREDEGVSRYLVWRHDGTRADGALIGYTFGEDQIFDGPEDIGFLRVPSSVGRDRVMTRGVGRDLAAGEPLLQIGHPWILDYWTPTVGPFLRHREPFFTSNVPGQPGVSGSPVLDLDGTVVGTTWGGHYHMAPARTPRDAPMPGDGMIRTTFEEAVNGLHSYTHRITTAFDTLA